MSDYEPIGIIPNFFDTDFYKLTMGQIVFFKYSDVEVKYKLIIRNPNIRFTSKMYLDILESIKYLSEIETDPEMITYIKNTGLFKEQYLDFLKSYKFDNSCLHISYNSELEIMDITIEGLWYKTIYYETILLSIITEIYYNHYYCHTGDNGLSYYDKNISSQLYMYSYHNIFIADFGTRRRFSKQHQINIINQMKEQFSSINLYSSNVLISKYTLSDKLPIGTMGHEFIQAHQALCNPIDSQIHALNSWLDFYRGNPGIALSDTLGTDKFFKDFDKYFCNVYEGVQQDSGNPYHFAEKMIDHYDKMGIDPKSKTILFSDGLDIQEVSNIYHKYNERINVKFGIGTHLTGIKYESQPLLNIVIKMVECNGHPVIKLSDSEGKELCENQDYNNYIKSCLTYNKIKEL